MNYWTRRCCSECGTVIDDGTARIVRGRLTVDRALRRVLWDEAELHFAKTEFEIIELLATREGRVVQKWAFFIDILNEDVDDKILDVFICKIRARFTAIDPKFDLLKTVWGEGYLWQKSDRPALAEPVDQETALRARLARRA